MALLANALFIGCVSLPPPSKQVLILRTLICHCDLLNPFLSPVGHSLPSPPLFQVAASYGCRCFIVMPDDAAIEKANILSAMGEVWGTCHQLLRAPF